MQNDVTDYVLSAATMKISIVIPVYNCVETIEQTLLSVLSQGYKELELIVVDGGSTDGTLDILNKYSEQINHLISEKDDGQYDAINKGFSFATGDIFAWLNGDDIYLSGSLSTVSSIFKKFEDVHWISGLPGFLNKKGEYIRIDSSPSAYPGKFIRNGWYRSGLCGYLQQESMFWRQELWQKCDGLNTELKLAADFELWTRFAKQSELVQVLSPLAAFRFTPEVQRSVVYADDYISEIKNVCQIFKKPPLLWRLLSCWGQLAQMVLRLLIWRKAELMVYNREAASWFKVKCFCNVSRRTLIDYTADYLGRKRQ